MGDEGARDEDGAIDAEANEEGDFKDRNGLLRTNFSVKSA